MSDNLFVINKCEVEYENGYGETVNEIQIRNYKHSLFISQTDEIYGKPFEAIIHVDNLQLRQLYDIIGKLILEKKV